MYLMSKSLFPKGFLWGAATAAHQVEGGNHNQWSVWELENAKARAAQAEYHYHDLPVWEDIKTIAKQPGTYVSGRLADHYNRYEEDFDFLEKMHMNAYRFSIEWSRIEPQEGSWNAEAIAHYKAYLSSLRQRGIEPIVTLFHFSLPVWFAKKGGFEHRANVRYFVRYAQKIMTELGVGIRYVITINEPDMYARHGYLTQIWPPNLSNPWKAWRVNQNLAYAHKKTAIALRGINRRYKIGIAKNTAFFYPGDDAWLSRVSAAIKQYVNDDWIIRKYRRHSDFLGVNYYFTNRVYGYRVHNPDTWQSDLGWDMQPGDLQYVLEHLDRAHKLPLLVTENGLADMHDTHRKEWLKRTIVALQQARANHVNVIGYIHWSLMDNFEWADGKWPQFGLVAVDYKTGARSLRPSGIWFGQVIKKLRHN